MFRRSPKSSFKSKKEVWVPKIPPQTPRYRMPCEETPHEATWLAWPHDHGWDSNHVERYERIWIQMTRALAEGERVYIIVYDGTQEQRVSQVLQTHHVDLAQIRFFQWPTDDVWIRDYGPLFVHNLKAKQLEITNWVFNGWGDKAEWYRDNYIPLKVGHSLQLPVMDVPMVNEGGSIEIDGNGTMLAKKSSILNDNRNPGWKQADAEAYFRHYFGVTNFIWLKGTTNDKNDITDDHIDGTARFANGDTIITFHKYDFVNKKEYDILVKAKNVDEKQYQIVHLPVTKHKLEAIGDYGIYINYYVGNAVVLVPAFDDPHDNKAVEVLQQVYPSKRVVSIECTQLYKDGGMLHCVTQQQPIQPIR